MEIAQPDTDLFVITEKGYGKRTPVEEYRITNRGGIGIKNYAVTEKTGGVVGIKVVGGEEDLLLVTQAGILIRTHVDTIRVAGRATQGVIVMRFKEEGDKVISLALADREEENSAPAARRLRRSRPPKSRRLPRNPNPKSNIEYIYYE